jgi:hypothetical protein
MINSKHKRSICIGNSTVSSAIWKKTCTSEFFKDYQSLKSLKNSRVYVFQIARETILLLINNIHEKLCSHVRKSHLEIKKSRKLRNLKNKKLRKLKKLRNLQ